MDAPELKLKIFSAESEKTIIELLKSASETHKQPINQVSWFKWKFMNSPFGPAIICYAESHDNFFAGAVAFGMYELKFNNRIVKAALSYETFVHPSFQGKGLFTKLTRMAMEEAKKRGAEILFNFPNTKSLPGFKKLGWSHSNCVKFWVRPTSFFEFIFRFNPKAFKKSFIADKANAETLIHENLWRSLKINFVNVSDGKIAANRTLEYLEWRYGTYPLNNYQLLSFEEGFCILRTGKRGPYREAQILEFFPAKGKFCKKYIKQIIKQIQLKINPDLITTNVSKAHPVNRFLIKTFFFPLPNHINFTVFPLHKELEELRDGENWIITGTEFHTY